MGRTRFSATPQLRKFGEILLQTFALRAMTQVAPSERRQGGLALADLMQDLQGIERGEFRSQRLFGGGRNRFVGQETVARSRRLVIQLLDLGSLSGLGAQLERGLEIVHIQTNHSIEA